MGNRYRGHPGGHPCSPSPLEKLPRTLWESGSELKTNAMGMDTTIRRPVYEDRHF
jgi:hypothetical protein